MITILAGSLLALTPAAVCTAPQDPPGTLADRVGAYLDPLVEADIFSGAVLLARGGEILVERGYGMADIGRRSANRPETRFKLMSVSKTFTGVLVVRLASRGTLALDDPVAAHVAGWPEPWAEVTVHDLLDHTSGIPNLEVRWGSASRRLHRESDAASLVSVWHELAPELHEPLATRPGTAFAYSNFNTILAGLVAERAGGAPYGELVAEHVLGPAKLTATGIDDGQRHDGLAIGYFRGRDGEPVASEQNMGHIRPAGGYCSTVRDLYRFDRALRDDTLLDEASRRRLVTPRAGDYACCFFNRPVLGRACVQHSGGANGYVAEFLRFVDDDACVVVLSNFAFAPIGRIGNDLAALLFDLDCELPSTVAPELLSACAGTYAWPGGKAHRSVRRSGGALLSFDLYPGSERTSGRLLLAHSPTRFREAFGDAIVVFEPAGPAPGLRRITGDGEIVLPRVETGEAAWRALAGPWRSTPPLGDAVRLVIDDGRLWLRVDGGWPQALEVAPVTGDVAIALYDGQGGTLLRREGDELRFTRADGERFRLTRR